MNFNGNRLKKVQFKVKRQSTENPTSYWFQAVPLHQPNYSMAAIGGVIDAKHGHDTAVSLAKHSIQQTGAEKRAGVKSQTIQFAKNTYSNIHLLVHFLKVVTIK